jgi:hypothetical protein
MDLTSFCRDQVYDSGRVFLAISRRPNGKLNRIRWEMLRSIMIDTRKGLPQRLKPLLPVGAGGKAKAEALAHLKPNVAIIGW